MVKIPHSYARFKIYRDEMEAKNSSTDWNIHFVFELINTSNFIKIIKQIYNFQFRKIFFPQTPQGNHI